jgi:hypothetical protein
MHRRDVAPRLPICNEVEGLRSLGFFLRSDEASFILRGRAGIHFDPSRREPNQRRGTIR